MKVQEADIIKMFTMWKAKTVKSTVKQLRPYCIRVYTGVGSHVSSASLTVATRAL